MRVLGSGQVEVLGRESKLFANCKRETAVLSWYSGLSEIQPLVIADSPLRSSEAKCAAGGSPEAEGQRGRVGAVAAFRLECRQRRVLGRFAAATSVPMALCPTED
jgi:hypothetical protein